MKMQFKTLMIQFTMLSMLIQNQIKMLFLGLGMVV